MRPGRCVESHSTPPWRRLVRPERRGQEQTINTTKVDNVACATVNLRQSNYDECYFDYANRTLWLLFHYRLDLTDFDRRNSEGYFRVKACCATG